MKGKIVLKYVAIALIMACLSLSGWAEEVEPVISKKEQKEVVEKMGELLNKNYIFPETAKKMSLYLLENLKKGKYDSISYPQEFARQLTEDLQEISRDLHIQVSYAPEQVIRLRKLRVSDGKDPGVLAQRLRYMRRLNFGFKEVKILEGNIGYLDLRGFLNPEWGGETAVAAMNYLANCDTLIIDLRKNGGGSPGMIQLISSFLFSGAPEHLNTFYWRPSDKHVQYWTLPYIPGKRMPDTPVYVLTSRYTFSAAEEFCYNLKNMKRATLVGETTGGGAHPGGPEVVNDRFIINIPSGRAINPITKTNWEGTGVKPDIEVNSEKALDVARIKALEELEKKAQDPEEKAWYKWFLDGLKAEITVVTVNEETLKSYVGNYGSSSITWENGSLYFQQMKQPRMKMIPMTEDLFKFTEEDYFRLKIIKKEGKIIGLEALFNDGSSKKSMKEG